MRWYQQIPFAAISVLLSLVLGIVLWATKITGESVAILSAILLELVIVAHRLLFNSEREVDPLRGLVRTTQIRDALAAARSILKSGNPHSQALLNGATEAFARRVIALDGGGVRCSPSEFMDFTGGLLATASEQDTLRATSHLAGGGYWQHTYGKQYEAINKRAVARGLTIQRIYLLRDAAHLAEVRDVLDRQSAFSQVRYILLDEVDDTVQTPNRDFYVYGSDVAAEFHFTEQMMVDHVMVMTRREEVAERAREYERLVLMSEIHLPRTTALTTPDAPTATP